MSIGKGLKGLEENPLTLRFSLGGTSPAENPFHPLLKSSKRRFDVDIDWVTSRGFDARTSCVEKRAKFSFTISTTARSCLGVVVERASIVNVSAAHFLNTLDYVGW